MLKTGKKLILSTLAGLCAIYAVIGNVPAAVADPATQSDVYEIPDLEKLQRTFERLAVSVRPCVVAITTYRNLSSRKTGELSIPNGVGSGFVYSSSGLIATNHHVIEGSDRIDVVLHDGRSFEAEVVQFDPRSDLAVLKIPAENLRVAPLGELSEIRPGRWAFTVGNPFGLAGQNGGNTSVAFGTVTAVGQFLDVATTGKDRYYGNLIQTDASINPGNSGGPLFNIRGQVIGVATAMLSGSGVDEGVGFAIPISARTRRILDMLGEGREVRYGYLGVRVTTLDQQASANLGIPYRRGAVLTAIPKTSIPSPAAKAGLKPGDVITEIDGKPIYDSDQLVRLVGMTPVGTEVEVVYFRDKREYSTTVKLNERAETAAARINSRQDAQEPKSIAWRGATIVEVPRKHKADRGGNRNEGLYVADLPEDTQLYRRGLRAGDVIVKFDDKRLWSIDDLAAYEKTAGNSIKLKLRDNSIIRLVD